MNETATKPEEKKDEQEQGMSFGRQTLAALKGFSDEAALGGAAEYAYHHLKPGEKTDMDELREENPVLANIAQYGGMIAGLVNPLSKLSLAGKALRGLKVVEEAGKAAGLANKFGEGSKIANVATEAAGNLAGKVGVAANKINEFRNSGSLLEKSVKSGIVGSAPMTATQAGLAATGDEEAQKDLVSQAVLGGGMGLAGAGLGSLAQKILQKGEVKKNTLMRAAGLDAPALNRLDKNAVKTSDSVASTLEKHFQDNDYRLGDIKKAQKEAGKEIEGIYDVIDSSKKVDDKALKTEMQNIQDRSGEIADLQRKESRGLLDEAGKKNLEAAQNELQNSQAKIDEVMSGSNKFMMKDLGDIVEEKLSGMKNPPSREEIDHVLQQGLFSGGKKVSVGARDIGSAASDLFNRFNVGERTVAKSVIGDVQEALKSHLDDMVDAKLSEGASKGFRGAKKESVMLGKIATELRRIENKNKANPLSIFGGALGAATSNPSSGNLKDTLIKTGVGLVIPPFLRSALKKSNLELLKAGDLSRAKGVFGSKTYQYLRNLHAKNGLTDNASEETSSPPNENDIVATNPATVPSSTSGQENQGEIPENYRFAAKYLAGKLGINRPTEHQIKGLVEQMHQKGHTVDDILLEASHGNPKIYDELNANINGLRGVQEARGIINDIKNYYKNGGSVGNFFSGEGAAKVTQYISLMKSLGIIDPMDTRSDQDMRNQLNMYGGSFFNRSGAYKRMEEKIKQYEDKAKYRLSQSGF